MNLKCKYKLSKFKIIFIIISIIILYGCSSIQENETSNNSTEAYVFDNIEITDSTKKEPVETNESTEIVEKTIEMYIVQIGAFTTQEKAEVFLNKFKNKIKYDLNIHFDEGKGLYVIQLPPFRTREEALKVRDELKTINELEGTFIVPNNK
ncbi:MAG: hypothetical protein COW71_06925 [Ignavibacteriales bacterium CG18_big_fil_WC_8_21_14_2_50_31_20]|nr:MAG: hypothetical protein COW71_06925 [Ignavibacteriales bacterium CG18_big_fil_WC_8_21_14_2_50_31_20]